MDTYMEFRPLNQPETFKKYVRTPQEPPTESLEERNEKQFFDPPLWKQRRSFAYQTIKENQIESVFDCGCGEGALLEILLNDTRFFKVAGVDVDVQALAMCKVNCSPTPMDFQFLRELPVRLDLYKGSLDVCDTRCLDYDCITLLEVIEHLHSMQLQRLPYTIFREYQPRLVIISTPNAEFNINFPNLKYGTAEQVFRHWDHKFEWTRREFQEWSVAVAREFNYSVEFGGVGLLPNQMYDVGNCSQIAVFKRLGEKLPIRALTPYHHYFNVDFPYFEEDGFCDEAIVDALVAESPNLIIDWKTLDQLEYFTFEQYWDRLTIRQMCKKRDRMVQAFHSDYGKTKFIVDGEFVKLLFSIEPPACLQNNDEDFVKFESDSSTCEDEIGSAMSQDEEPWGVVYQVPDGVDNWDNLLDVPLVETDEMLY